jgi:hypothetical protein
VGGGHEHDSDVVRFVNNKSVDKSIVVIFSRRHKFVHLHHRHPLDLVVDCSRVRLGEKRRRIRV